MIEQTLRRFPMTPEMRDECALPFAFTMCPFAPHASCPPTRTPKLVAASVPRCPTCYAYINQFCGVDILGWRCALCGAYSEFGDDQSKRYGRTQSRESVPELNGQLYEVLCPSRDVGDEDREQEAVTGPFPAPRNGQPVFVALISTHGSSDYIELVRTGLAAALEALPPNALVGIVTLSDSVGLWDCKGVTPVQRSVPILPDSRLMCPLAEALPLRSLLAPLATCRTGITATLDALHPSSQPRVALGSAVNALLDYLSGLSTPDVSGPAAPASASAVEAERGVRFGHARLAVFLASAPNLGPGSTVSGASAEGLENAPSMGNTSPYPGHGEAALAYSAASAPAPEDALPGSQDYYEQLALVAAMLGVCIDLYAVGPSFIGIEFLGPLCQKTGGACNFYPVLEEAALPQDLYRRVQGPHALSCLLRVRTCPEMKVVGHHGRLFEDADHDQMFHMVSCDSNDSIALEVEFTSTQGFLTDSGHKVTHPVVQVAFQYSFLVGIKIQSPEGTGDGGEGEVGARPALRYEMQRRMRICTVAPRVAKSHEVVFSHTQVEQVIAVLMHKVLARKALLGSEKARELLQTWFTTLCTRYHHHVAKLPFGTTPRAGEIDVLMSTSKSSTALTSQVYALLRSPFLKVTAPQYSDLTAYLTLLWSNLPANELHRAVCPLLVSFKDPEEEFPKRQLLSRSTLDEDDCPILLLDAFHIILVIYRNNCPPEIPFPPPPASRLRTSVQSLRQERRIAPQVKFIRERDPEMAILHSFLVDEAQEGVFSGSASEASSMGFAQWADYIQTNVQKALAQAAA